ncbi:YafY family protein [Cohnella sp. WQ 127256]|uniref:helix-turn-helix transcriptional regulator n=1 Tax=Cohnella sp. WQ 127256 TaxID=2938790 RepID=UPI0021184B7E|nr:YafY family protein [Cohnella sp. WQ 127256]
MRANRLLIIMSLLQAHGQLSSRELAEQLEVSERTIHRDMEALSLSGIPVYAERGSKGGWLLSEGYRNQITGMTADEIRSLLLIHSSSVVKDLGLNDQVQTAFRKLLSALPIPAQRDAEYVRERIHVDGAGWHSPAPSNTSILQTIQQCVWEQRKLNISYRSWDTDSDTQRTVSPLGLVAKQSIWYMIAQTGDNEIRTFRISRLKVAYSLEETFTRPEAFHLASYWEHSMKSFKSSLPSYLAQVRIAPTRWNKFCQERYLTVQSHELLEDNNWIEATVEFQAIESACEILLGLGRHAQALAPEPLRHAINQEIEAMASYYADSTPSIR